MLASVKMLLAAVVDYAGLFPPAGLNLQAALKNYACDRSATQGWMLNSFVLPSSRLQEFATLFSAQLSTQPAVAGQPRLWHISIILSPKEVKDLKGAIANAQAVVGNLFAIRGVELPPLSATEIEQTLAHLPVDIETYFELKIDDNLLACLEVLQGTRAAAKIRTGGMTPAAFPSVAEVGRFIVVCAKAGVPFKATAGLHHPLPGQHHITDAPDSAFVAMQGFLNVAIAAALVHQKTLGEAAAIAILQETSDHAFQFTKDGLSWHDNHLTLTEIAASRRYFFKSFGSCSFQDPIHDLKHLQLLS